MKNNFAHLGYELTEKDFFINSTNKCTKISYYWFNWKEILQKAKKDIPKTKLLSIIYQTKKQQKITQRIDTKTCQKKKKTVLKSIRDKNISNWFSTKYFFSQYKNE